MVGKKVNVHGNGVRSSNEETEWEVRPGGMLVQKMSDDAPAPTNAKIQTATRAINNIILQLDHLAQQVSAIDKSISNGDTVPEIQISTLIEMLMRQAIKLKSISTEGDVSAH
ncbi:hypothetical protein HN51_057365 [Arachis hypogaea]